MCPGSGTESRGIINGLDPLLPKDNNGGGACGTGGGDYNDAIMRPLVVEGSGGDGGTGGATTSGFLQGFLQRFFPANSLLRTLPLSEVSEELRSLLKIACPIIMTSMLLYSRSIVSMLFLGRLGKTELAGGSLALGFGNITGNSILRGLSTGMDPICCQAYGAKRLSVLSHAFQKTFCLLLLVSIPIATLWLNMEPICIWLGQDPAITRVAKIYMAFSVPELLAQAHLQPLRIFLRTQGLTVPLTVAATCSAILHLPINYFLVTYLKLGVAGVALALAWNTMNLNVGLLIYILVSSKPLKPWSGLTILSTFTGWGPLLKLALPSCAAVCLEWWWYEIMMFLCGILKNPQASLASMGILIQTTGMLYVFPISLSAGLTTRVGHALGSGQPVRAQWTAILGLTLAFGFGLSALVFTIVARSWWGRLYTDEPQVLDMLSKTLPLLGLCELGNTPQTAACGVLNGMARPNLGARINLCAFYGVGLPVAVLATFTFRVGFLGLWIGLLSAQIACLSMMVYVLIQTDWKQQSKRAEEMASGTDEENEKNHREEEEEEEDEETGLLSTNI
ncbi:protein DETOXIFICATION 53 [Humulus lupulus]|uniref:protein DETOXIFICATION 53 n=1 Tax=Humulus lupulus TaxID=3486 RepID=UPI002B40F6EA|nr:protein DETOXIFICATION 53 [Humulus lupulus]